MRRLSNIAGVLAQNVQSALCARINPAENLRGFRAPIRGQIYHWCDKISLRLSASKSVQARKQKTNHPRLSATGQRSASAITAECNSAQFARHKRAPIDLSDYVNFSFSSKSDVHEVDNQGCQFLFRLARP